MFIRRSYRDLSPELRRKGAKDMRDRIMGALRSPGITPEQITALKGELKKVELWANGTLEPKA